MTTHKDNLIEGEMTFEKALEKLEGIVGIMESRKLPLDEMIKNYEAGKELSDFCSKKLTEFEKKIEILVKDSENKNF